MRLPFLQRAPKKSFPEMTEEELEQGIARRERTLEKEKPAHTALAHATILAAGGGIFAGVFLFAVVAPGALLAIAAAAGGSVFFGGGYTCKAVMTHAVRQRNQMVDVFNAKLTARLAAEQEEERLRRMTIEEKFNAAVDAGLPLEKDITVRKALKLKFPEPRERHGFARIAGIFDPSP
ncbi:MAG: hypothetical protein EPN97_15620 [Alphaproteobacteria bacterium]|nr:MAG: hypothetical protein EPN97_15620 [Alphaproteobacteria bacterium]